MARMIEVVSRRAAIEVDNCRCITAALRIAPPRSPRCLTFGRGYLLRPICFMKVTKS